MPDNPRASSAGLKRSGLGVNANGGHFREVLDGILYVDADSYQQFKAELKELCNRFDYRFVPFDRIYEVDSGQMDHRLNRIRTGSTARRRSRTWMKK